MIYIQVAGNIVTLIGGAEVGLPLSEGFLTSRPEVLCLQASDFNKLPGVGDYYNDGEFYTQEEMELMNDSGDAEPGGAE